jgi:polysaccharide biosynthesis transport protein
LSAEISRNWAVQFTRSNLDRRYASTKEARAFLQERLGQLGEKLEISERELVAYASDKQIVTLGGGVGSDGGKQPQRTLAAADLEALNKELASATADRIRAAAGVRNAGATNSEALKSITISQLRAKRAEIAAEYAKLLVTFEPQYPPALALSSQIKSLDRAVALEEGRYKSNRRISSIYIS